MGDNIKCPLLYEARCSMETQRMSTFRILLCYVGVYFPVKKTKTTDFVIKHKTHMHIT